MKGKTTKGSRLRLSPNEEAQLIREELERRRKLRLQQVREQERYVALQVRREVKERKEKELQSLAETLREEWQKQQREKIQSLEKIFQGSFRSIGQGHRSAKKNEPDWNALAWKREWNDEQAAQRHQQALRDLESCRRAQEEHRTWPLEARQKALMVEKDRATKVASLPLPAPNPIENIAIQTLPPPKMANLEHYSITHYHVPETVVHRETIFEQPNAQQAAVLEAQRLEELEREEACDRKEQLEKAQLRGDHALRKEKVVQDQSRLLYELEHLHQADLQRRSRVMNSVPVHIFQPLYRHRELRTEHQEKLEIAFQNMYTSEREVKGDLVLQLVPEPLPPPSVGSHDEDLDVTLDKELEITPHDEAEEWEKSATPPTQPIGRSISAVGTVRQPLRRLLERIRNQREQWRSKENPVGHGISAKDNSSIETGSVSNQEWGQTLSPGQDTPCQSETKSESLVAGSTLRPEENVTETEKTAPVRAKGMMCSGLTAYSELERELLRQQQEQLVLLKELEDKRYNLELQLQDVKEYKQKLQQALPVHSGACSSHKLPTEPQEVILGPTPDLDIPAKVEVLSDSMHKQRLLDQKRLHKKNVADAWRHLEEYQRTLKLRYATITTMAAQTEPHPVTEETICPLPSLIDMANPAVLAHLLESKTGLPIPLETPQGYHHLASTESQTSANPAQNLSSPKLPQPSEAAFSTSDTQQEVSVALVSTLGASCLSEESPRDAVTELEEFPLPPPSVVLERLLSHQPFPPATKLAPLSLESHEVRSGPEVETDWSGKEQMRKRQALQTSLRAEHVKVESSSLIEESTRLLTSCTNQCHSCTFSSFPVYSECCVCKSERCAQVKALVSRPPRTLQVLLQDLVQSKLSTIQEVDTPASVTLGKGAELSMQRSSKDCSDHSESSSVPVSPPSVESGLRKGLISGSDDMSSENTTCGVNRMSWRETLQLESTGSHAQSCITGEGSMDQLQLEEPAFVLPHDGTSAEPGHLSSTTISTGSCSAYEHDPSYSKTDSSPFSSESAGRAGPSLTCSGSMFGCGLPKATDSSKFNSGLQCIINKYTNELDTSLKEVQTGLLKVCLTPEPSSSTLNQQTVVIQRALSSHYFRNDILQDLQTSSHSHGTPLSDFHGGSADQRSSKNPGAEDSSYDNPVHFRYLQAYPDFDSTPPLSFKKSERKNQTSHTQGCDATNGHIQDVKDQIWIKSYDTEGSTLTQQIGQPLKQSSLAGLKPMSPVVTHNDMAECSILDLAVIKAPPVGNSSSDGDTAAAQKASTFADVTLLPHLSTANICYNDSIPDPIKIDFPVKEADSGVTLNLQLHCGIPYSFSTEHQKTSGPADISFLQWKEILEPYSDEDIYEESEISLVSLSDTTLENDCYKPPPLKEEQSGEREAKEKLEKEGVGGNEKIKEHHHNDMENGQFRDSPAPVSHACILHTDSMDKNPLKAQSSKGCKILQNRTL